MKKNKIKFVRFVIAIIILWIVIILGFSLCSGTVSHEESGYVNRWLTDLINKFGIHINKNAYKIILPFLHDKVHITSEAIVRKIAHWFEYLVLGLLCGAILLNFRNRSKWWLMILLSGPVISLVDERFIQQFLVTGRTSSYMDMLLDCIGYYFALILLFILYSIIIVIKSRITRHRSNAIKLPVER